MATDLDLQGQIWFTQRNFSTKFYCWFADFVNIKWDHRLFTFSESIAGDRSAFMTIDSYISFVVDRRRTFRSIIDIAIDRIHIGTRIFSVNHSGVRCLQPRVHRDPHACATRYLMSWHGISKHKNTREFHRNCRAEYGIVTWRTIYSNAKSYSFRTILLGRPVCFLWTVTLCLQSDSPVHRTKDDTASSTGC